MVTAYLQLVIFILDDGIKESNFHGTATSYGLDGPGFESRQRQEIFLFSNTVQNGPGAHPASYTMGTGYLSRG
jgi:hypothetical protein